MARMAPTKSLGPTQVGSDHDMIQQHNVRWSAKEERARDFGSGRSNYDGLKSQHVCPSLPNGLRFTGANRTRRSIALDIMERRFASGATAELDDDRGVGPFAMTNPIHDDRALPKAHVLTRMPPPRAETCDASGRARRVRENPPIHQHGQDAD